MKFDNVSFSKEGFDKFKTLTKEKQIEKLANMLNPKEEERAKVLLKNTPNGGDIVQGNEPKTDSDNASGLAGGNGGNNPIPAEGTETSQKKRVPKRR